MKNFPVNQDFSSIQTWVNGKPQALASLFDRGLNYGEGVFETIGITPKGKAYLWPEHKQRLLKGCNVLSIPFEDIDTLELEVEQLCQSVSLLHDKSQAVLKIIITRGNSAPGYYCPPHVKPNRYTFLKQGPCLPQNYYTQGVTLKLCEHRLSLNRPLQGIKHLNRMDQTIARGEWEGDFFEGLVLDQEGYLIEGTMSNLFLCFGNHLLTPRLDSCGVAGVMREHLLTLGGTLSFTVEEARLNLADLLAAEGVFICNSVIGVLQYDSSRT